MATASATPRTSTTLRSPRAVYLCSGKDNLSTRKGQEAAVFRYNHSQDYVNLVLRIMEAYSSGDYSAVPSGTLGGTSFSPSYSSAIDRTYQVAQERKQREEAAKTTARGTSSGSSSSGSTDGATPGGGSTGASTPPDGGGNGGDGGAGGVVTDSGEAIGGATGGGSSDGGTPPPSPSPSPSPSPPVMSIAEATENCLAGDPLLTGGALDACIALQLDDTETAPYPEDTGAVEPSLGQE